MTRWDGTMENKTEELVQYINSLLNDLSISPSMPETLAENEDIQKIDHTLRNLRHAIKAIGNGDLSAQLLGKGYLMGTVKSLQATLKNLIWQTQSIASGNFSHRIEFFGEFSDAFNSMVKKLEQTISDLNDSKALFELFFETIPDGTMIVSYDEFIIFNCNQAYVELVGLKKEHLLEKTLHEISFFKDGDQQKQFEQAVKGGEKPQSISLELKLMDGSLYHGLFSSAIIWIENKKYILSVIKNITELKELEKKLRESEEMHRLLADNASDVIWTMDLTGQFSYVSPSVEKLRGYTVDEVMTQSKEALLCPSSLIHLEKGLEDAIYYVQNNLPFKIFRADVEQPCKDGTTVWTDLTVSGIYDKENRFLGMLGVSRDITERKMMEDEIRRLTEVDGLTQLYNRFKLDAVLKDAFEKAQMNHTTFAIVILDVDNFKHVNDTYGHLKGDEVLKEIAEIIKRCIRIKDTVGRWGGEEFMVIMPDANVDEGVRYAEKMRLEISKTVFQGVGKLTASFGVAAYEESVNEAELISRADNAMYKAKDSGKNRVCQYENNLFF